MWRTIYVLLLCLSLMALPAICGCDDEDCEECEKCSDCDDDILAPGDDDQASDDDADDDTLDDDTPIPGDLLLNDLEIVQISGSQGETVDNFQWMALDRDGYVHASYNDDYNYHLMYATNRSGAWLTEVVDESDESGVTSAIAVDADGKAHISYSWQDDSNSAVHIRYATNKSGEWVIKPVAMVGDEYFSFSSIALDAQGNPQIAFSFIDVLTWEGAFALVTLSEDGLNWIYEWIQAILANNFVPNLAIGIDGLRHVLWMSESSSGDTDLVYSNDMWETWLMRGGAESYIGIDTAMYQSLTTRRNSDAAYFCYADTLVQKLYYVEAFDKDWNDEIVHTSGDAPAAPSLALSQDATPHIVYSDGNKNRLVYAIRIGEDWYRAKIDQDLARITYANIAVDGDNRVHVIYQKEHQLWHASFAPELVEE